MLTPDMDVLLVVVGVLATSTTTPLVVQQYDKVKDGTVACLWSRFSIQLSLCGNDGHKVVVKKIK